MTRIQYERRLMSLGATEVEAERISANCFCGVEMDTQATKLTNQQRTDMLILIADMRSEYSPWTPSGTVTEYKRIWGLA